MYYSLNDSQDPRGYGLVPDPQGQWVHRISYDALANRLEKMRLEQLEAAVGPLVEALQSLLYACDSPELIVKARAALSKAGVA